jgi:hypothetical protein
VIKAENGFLVERTPGHEKGYEGHRFVFMNPSEVAEFFRAEALAMEQTADRPRAHVHPALRGRD